jgi:hypothetical protein
VCSDLGRRHRDLARRGPSPFNTRYAAGGSEKGGRANQINFRHTFSTTAGNIRHIEIISAIGTADDDVIFAIRKIIVAITKGVTHILINVLISLA